jgi:hypothetical protein
MQCTEETRLSWQAEEGEAVPHAIAPYHNLATHIIENLGTTKNYRYHLSLPLELYADAQLCSIFSRRLSWKLGTTHQRQTNRSEVFAN